MCLVNAPGTTSACFSREDFNGQCVVQSYNLTTIKLFVIRLFFLLAAIGVLALNIYKHHDVLYLSFYIHNLSYYLLLLYLLLTLYFTSRHLFSRHHEFTPFLYSRAFAPFVYLMIYNFTAVFAALTALAYWSLEYKNYLNPQMSLELVLLTLMNTGTLIVVLFEAFLSCNPMHLVFLPIILVFVGVYIMGVFMSLISFPEAAYVLLDPSKEQTQALIYAAVTMGSTLAIFCLFYLVHLVRDHFGVSSFTRAPKELTQKASKLSFKPPAEPSHA